MIQHIAKRLIGVLPCLHLIFDHNPRKPRRYDMSYGSARFVQHVASRGNTSLLSLGKLQHA